MVAAAQAHALFDGHLLGVVPLADEDDLFAADGLGVLDAGRDRIQRRSLGARIRWLADGGGDERADPLTTFVSDRVAVVVSVVAANFDVAAEVVRVRVVAVTRAGGLPVVIEIRAARIRCGRVRRRCAAESRRSRTAARAARATA